jgi:hypothetical protein
LRIGKSHLAVWGKDLYCCWLMSDEHPHPNAVTDPIIEEPLVVKQLSTLGFLYYILHGIGVSLGLCLLWGLEAVRNSTFRMLDRMNFKARIRPASPFPPGQARKRPLTAASR